MVFGVQLFQASLWILRKFADSGIGPGEAENALLLPKQMETLTTAKLLSNISKLDIVGKPI